LSSRIDALRPAFYDVLCCPITEEQLISLLGDGDPDRAAIDAMLARLDADWLDERERLLIPIARDTMRTQQPLLIQRRMRELRQKLTPAELVDFIGIASVANAVGRLGVLLQQC
jgi:alkylhydroperoxidase family enzyme